MRRPNPSAAARSVLGLAVLAAATTGSVQATPADCPRFDADAVEASVQAAEVIVAATVVRSDESGISLSPSFFLKGAATAGDIVLPRPPAGDDCPPAEFGEGQRVLVVLAKSQSRLAWPGPSAVFTLVDGRATNQETPPARLSEAELVERIRAVTGQYAVPATDEGEGAAVGWLTTIVPLGIALVLLFGVGLVLMRIWHRIDPS